LTKFLTEFSLFVEKKASSTNDDENIGYTNVED
jgi:hypothetical protein